MADFRRWILALATLALVLGLVAPASAQVSGPQLNCTVAGAVPPTLRAEGMDELVGDILLTCQAANPSVTPITGTPLPQANISVSLGAALSTNWYVNSNPAIGAVSSAVLVIDDPNPANQTLCSQPSNPTIACAVTFPTGTTNFSFNQPGITNVFQGVPGGPGTNSITFLGVPIEPPVTSRTFRITNIRINASGVGASSFGLSPVAAYVSSSSSTSIQITGGQTVVGYVENGLTTSTSPSGTSFLQCQGSQPPSTPVPVGSITYKENFATAFKVVGAGQDQPGTVYYSESGLEVSEWGSKGLITASAASTGTRLMATISGVPSNATLWVDTWAQSTAAVIVAGSVVQQSDATLVGTSSGTPVDPCPTYVATASAPSCVPPTQLKPSSAGIATAVWEVTSTNSSAIDSLTFNVYVSVPPSPGAPLPPATTVQGSFAPLGLSSGWVNGDAIPEFNPGVNTQPVSAPLFTTSPCVTYLLFPYVTDYLGEFDTGIAISNTSSDPSIGALPQAGGCTVNFYGMDQTTGANTAKTIGSNGTYSTTLAGINSGASSGAGLVEPGQSWTFSISAIDSAFGTNTYTGYAIATCDFQYAHGYTFVSDYGVREWAAATLALVIPDTSSGRGPYPFICGSVACNGTQTGEQLVH